MADETKNDPELQIDNIDHPAVQRALQQKGYRKQVEIDADIASRNTKLTARNNEIKALAVEAKRDHGSRIHTRKLADGKTEPVYVRDAVELVALECMAMDDSKPDTEIRQLFRSRIDDIKRDSIEEENILEEVDELNGKVASRCQDPFAVIKRTLENARKKGITSNGLIPDGAELEYNDHMRKLFKDIPGAGRLADAEGFMSPQNLVPRFEQIRMARRGGARMNRHQRRRAGTREQRDALASSFATAGAMIAPEFKPYIELLRNKIVLSELGCTYIGGLMGEQVFPRQEAATVAQSVAEGAQLNPFDQTLGQIKMNPHRAGSRQYYSRLALIQAPPDFEAMIWNDHAKVIALYQDEMGINGIGAADQPIGILNQPGINQILFGGAATYQAIINFRTAIRKLNVSGPLAFVTTSNAQGRLAFIPAALSGSTVITQGELDAIWKGDEIDGEILSCKAMASQQIPNDILLAGVFENLILASWGGIFTVVDNLTRADRDEVAITFNTYFDVAVRHAQAFTRSLDSAAQ